MSEPESVSISRRQGNRPKRIAVVLAVVLIALSAAAYLAFSGRSRPAEFRGALSAPVANLTTVLYSPDGRFLAAGSASGRVIVWNVLTGRREQLGTLTTEPILTMAMSPDGVLLAGGVEGSLVAWKLDAELTEKLTQKLSGFPSPLTCIAIRPGRAELAVGLSNGSLYFRGRSEPAHVDLEHKGGIKTGQFTPAGDLLVTGGTDGWLVWRDAESHKVLMKSEQAHDSEVSGLAFSPDGRFLASGDWNGVVRIWNVDTRRPQTRLTQPDAVAGLAWTGSLLVTGSWDGWLRVWSPAREQLIRQIDTGAAIHALAVSPGGDTIATVSAQSEVQLWRTPTE